MPYYRRGYRRSYGTRYGRRRYYRRPAIRNRRTYRRSRVPFTGIPEIKQVKFRTTLTAPWRFSNANPDPLLVENAAFNTYHFRLKANSLDFPFNAFFSDSYENQDFPAAAINWGSNYIDYRVYYVKVKATITNDGAYGRDVVLYHADSTDVNVNAPLEELRELPGISKIVHIPKDAARTVYFGFPIAKYARNTDPEDLVGQFIDEPTLGFTSPTDVHYIKFAFSGTPSPVNVTPAPPIPNAGDIRLTVELTQYVEFSNRRLVV